MANYFFNMIFFEPLYYAFSTYDIGNNLLQFSIIVMVILGVISWLEYVIN